LLTSIPATLQESFSHGPLVSGTVVLLLLLFAATCVPLLGISVGGRPHFYLYLYLVILPLSAAFIITLTAFFYRYIFARVIGTDCTLRESFMALSLLVRTSVLFLIIAGVVSIVWPNLISNGTSLPTFFTVLFVLVLAFLVASYFGAIQKKGLVWGFFAFAVFSAVFAPPYLIFTRFFWSPTMFSVGRADKATGSTVSLQAGSYVLYDSILSRIGGVERFYPVKYVNRGQGAEAWCGRIWGLPGERLEIVGGDLFFFESGEIFTKPADVQEKIWIPVAREDFEGPSTSRGWQATSNDWVTREGTLRVSSRVPTFLAFAPPADKSAYSHFSGITDLLVSAGPDDFTVQGTDTPFEPLPSNFVMERSRSGRPVYWGISGTKATRFCPRCGKPFAGEPPLKVPVNACRQCGQTVTKGEEATMPVFTLSGGENPVYDVRVDFTLTMQSATGSFLLRYAYHNVPLILRIDAASGVVKLEKPDSKDEVVIPKKVSLNVPEKFSFQCYDGYVEVIAGDYSASFSVDISFFSNPPFELAFGAEGGPFVVDDVSIFRDQYYTSSRGLYSMGSRSVVKVPVDSYFVLNDQGQEITDSRSWGCVAASDILGVPVLVLWPLFERAVR